MTIKAHQLEPLKNICFGATSGKLAPLGLPRQCMAKQSESRVATGGYREKAISRHLPHGQIFDMRNPIFTDYLF